MNVKSPEQLKFSNALNRLACLVGVERKPIFVETDLTPLLEQAAEEIEKLRKVGENDVEWVVYFSPDPLPINAPIEHYVEKVHPWVSFVGMFKAKNRESALDLAQKSAEEQWGCLGAGGYFAAFLKPDNFRFKKE